MKRHLALLALAAVFFCGPVNSAEAQRRGGGGGHGISRGPQAIGRSSSSFGGRARFGSGGAFGRTRGFGRGVGFDGLGLDGFGLGFGFGGWGGGYYGGWDIAALYRELLNNVPYYALHPPVYYSYPVPRTYGYSPFAYPPGVMTPDVTMGPVPEEIINPYVPSTRSEEPDAKTDTTAAVRRQPEPLVVINPFVQPNKAIARVDQ